MSADHLIYMPLGGAGEIGLNSYIYGFGPPDKERFIIVDLGVSFPDMDTTPGVDLILPDLSWIKKRRDRLEGILITHAHEDHIGAIGHLWEDLRVPVYCRAFTAHIARLKMNDAYTSESSVNTVEQWPKTLNLGPFKVGFVPISHSIPESSSVVIDTPVGRLVHTGDFKIDETPGVGEPFNKEVWRDIAKGGVKALICDSTNVFSKQKGRSEASISSSIQELIESAEKLVVATTFGSNVARLKTLAEAGIKSGRSVCLLGRAMRRMIDASVESGVLSDFPPLISPEDALNVPRQNLLILATGSQGERRAATAQLANGKYRGFSLQEGDLFIFSSKTIPGNEKGVSRIINQFSEMGVDVVEDDSGLYHVSGHANCPDLEQMHEIIQPQFLIPMHGEHRHLREHSKLALEKGIASIVCPNGNILSLSSNKPKILEKIELGRLYLDGSSKVPSTEGAVRDRIRMALNGLVIVTILLDEKDDLIGDPWCETKGLPLVTNSNAPLIDCLEEDLGQLIGRVDPDVILNNDKLEEVLKRGARQTCKSEIGKKPEISVIISRLA
jgi:ribonuclease J